ncbi:MAG: hypothetical protein AB8U44_00405 [Aaplasma endosymbiont of Hyalomma asiaticum]
MLAFDEPSNLNDSIDEVLTTNATRMGEEGDVNSDAVGGATEDVSAAQAGAKKSDFLDYYLSSDGAPKQQTSVMQLGDAKITVNLHTYTTWSTDVILEGGPVTTDKLLKNIDKQISSSNSDELTNDATQANTGSGSTDQLQNSNHVPTDMEEATDLLDKIGTALSEKFGQFLQLFTGSSDEEISDTPASSGATTPDQNTESEDTVKQDGGLVAESESQKQVFDKEEKSAVEENCALGKCSHEHNDVSTVAQDNNNTVAEPLEASDVGGSQKQATEQDADEKGETVLGSETASDYSEKKTFYSVLMDDENVDGQSNNYDFKDFFSGLPIA